MLLEWRENDEEPSVAKTRVSEACSWAELRMLSEKVAGPPPRRLGEKVQWRISLSPFRPCSFSNLCVSASLRLYVEFICPPLQNDMNFSNWISLPKRSNNFFCWKSTSSG